MVVAVSSALLATLPDRVTLAWQHSVEKVRWEEDYVASEGMLVLTEARIKGTGAGMEMPTDAVLANGSWHYKPRLAALPKIYISNSELPLGYDVCWNQRCTPLRAMIGAENRLLALIPCNQKR